jgi:hypothetical protein
MLCSSYYVRRKDENNLFIVYFQFVQVKEVKNSGSCSI